jgi:cholesterol transport system auxiliary component
VKRRVIIGALGAAAAGCSLAPTALPVAVYDFGPPPVGAAALPALRVLPVAAPAWLDGPGIVYRLDPGDGQRREVYRDSRWAASPAALLTQRLQPRVSAGGASMTLQLHLDEFAQVYGTAQRSRAVLRLRARLLGAGGEARFERSFAVEREAPTPDARGGVRALAQAADEALDQLLAWVTSLPR